MLEGWSRPQIFLRVMFPLLRNGIVATAVLCFIFAWNEFLFAFMLGGARRADPAGRDPQAGHRAGRALGRDGGRWHGGARAGADRRRAAAAPHRARTDARRRERVRAAPWLITISRLAPTPSAGAAGTRRSRRCCASLRRHGDDGNPLWRAGGHAGRRSSALSSSTRTAPSTRTATADRDRISSPGRSTSKALRRATCSKCAFEAIELWQDWGWNLQAPLLGTLPEDFPDLRRLHIPLDRDRMVARLPWGQELPLKPFFGVVGVAPPPGLGPADLGDPPRRSAATWTTRS